MSDARPVLLAALQSADGTAHGVLTGEALTTAGGNLSTVTDARGAVTRYVHDAQGRLLASTAADGANTNYGYDENGMLQGIADATPAAVPGFSFNSRGQLLRTIDKEQRSQL